MHSVRGRDGVIHGHAYRVGASLIVRDDVPLDPVGAMSTQFTFV